MAAEKFKLYKMSMNGAEVDVRLTEEEAELRGLIEVAEEEAPVFELHDARAPSAKGETHDDMGRELIQSARVENEERLKRKAERVAMSKVVAKQANADKAEDDEAAAEDTEAQAKARQMARNKAKAAVANKAAAATDAE